MSWLRGWLAAMASCVLATACEATPPPDPPPPVTIDCFPECNEDISHGVTGIREVDAYFVAVAALSVQAKALRADVLLEIETIARSLGVENLKGMNAEQLNAAIEQRVDAGIDGRLRGGLGLQFVEPRCHVSASVAIQAAARCDDRLAPSATEVECHGTCEADASLMPSCEQGATLTCKGTAPSFECDGTCLGSCELDADATCEGTCEGSCVVAHEEGCEGEFAAGNETSDGGTCKLRSGATCNGQCLGSCELSSTATCDGECKGECEYAPSGGRCPVGTTAACHPEKTEWVRCEGQCQGAAHPPQIRAECEATAIVTTALGAECVPPQIELKYDLTESTISDFASDSAAAAAFESQLRGLTQALAHLSAKRAKIEMVLRSAADLVGSGSNAVEGALLAAADQTVTLQARTDLACGIAAFADMPLVLIGAVEVLINTEKAALGCVAALRPSGSIMLELPRSLDAN